MPMQLLPGGAGQYQLVPQVGFVVTMPDWLLSSARMKRLHNRASKAAMIKTLEKHHKQRIPGHFRQTARGKYDHHERARGTKASKRRAFGSITDLVKTGRTKQSMTATRPKIQVGGRGESVMTGRMFMRFPFPVGELAGQSPRAVTVAKMADEIARWTDQEAAEAADDYRNFYVDALEELTANSPRIRKQIGGLMSALRG